jgi:tRNA 2-thiouridine synthesizing protein A
VTPGQPDASSPAGRPRPASARGSARRDPGHSSRQRGVRGGVAPALVIDALGRKCPIPIIMLAERIRDVPVGQVVAVLADDPAAESDMPAWCMLKSHEFVTAADLPDGGRAFLVRRSY